MDARLSWPRSDTSFAASKSQKRTSVWTICGCSFCVKVLYAYSAIDCCCPRYCKFRCPVYAWTLNIRNIRVHPVDANHNRERSGMLSQRMEIFFIRQCNPMIHIPHFGNCWIPTFCTVTLLAIFLKALLIWFNVSSEFTRFGCWISGLHKQMRGPNLHRVRKRRHQTHGNNSIHHTLHMLPHYLVKIFGTISAFQKWVKQSGTKTQTAKRFNYLKQSLKNVLPVDVSII